MNTMFFLPRHRTMWWAYGCAFFMLMGVWSVHLYKEYGHDELLLSVEASPIVILGVAAVWCALAEVFLLMVLTSGMAALVYRRRGQREEAHKHGVFALLAGTGLLSMLLNIWYWQFVGTFESLETFSTLLFLQMTVTIVMMTTVLHSLLHISIILCTAAFQRTNSTVQVTTPPIFTFSFSPPLTMSSKEEEIYTALTTLNKELAFLSTQQLLSEDAVSRFQTMYTSLQHMLTLYDQLQTPEAQIDHKTQLLHMIETYRHMVQPFLHTHDEQIERAFTKLAAHFHHSSHL